MGQLLVVLSVTMDYRCLEKNEDWSS